MEHWYNTKIGAGAGLQVVWFIGLLMLLSCNIFFAAARSGRGRSTRPVSSSRTSACCSCSPAAFSTAWMGVDAAMELVDTRNQSILNALYGGTALPIPASSSSIATRR